MKTIINFILGCVITTLSFGQTNPVKIVFDVTSSNSKVHQSTIRHVKMISETYANSKLEVVMYSGAMAMVLRDKSTVADDLEVLAKKDNVNFVICEGTMKRHNIKDSQIIPGVRSVPDGILEIIEKQREGWGYIKESQ